MGWRIGLVAVVAAAVLGALVPHAVVSGAESAGTTMVQAVESPPASPTSCADATCGKGSPAPTAPSPVVALVPAVLGALAVAAAVAARVRRRPAEVGALPSGPSRPANYHPLPRVLLARPRRPCGRRPFDPEQARRPGPTGSSQSPAAAAHAWPPRVTAEAPPLPLLTYSRRTPRCRSPVPGPRGPRPIARRRTQPTLHPLRAVRERPADRRPPARRSVRGTPSSAHGPGRTRGRGHRLCRGRHQGPRRIRRSVVVARSRPQGRT